MAMTHQVKLLLILELVLVGSVELGCQLPSSQIHSKTKHSTSSKGYIIAQKNAIFSKHS